MEEMVDMNRRYLNAFEQEMKKIRHLPQVEQDKLWPDIERHLKFHYEKLPMDMMERSQSLNQAALMKIIQLAFRNHNA